MFQENHSPVLNFRANLYTQEDRTDQHWRNTEHGSRATARAIDPTRARPLAGKHRNEGRRSWWVTACKCGGANNVHDALVSKFNPGELSAAEKRRFNAVFK